MECITRIATQNDKPALKALWQDTFHESQSFLDWFFDARFLPEYCAVSECEGRVVSCLHGLPAHVRVRDSILRCVLVSGVATLQEYRRQGLMRRSFAHYFAKMRARSIPLAVYTPVDLSIYAPFGHYPVSDAQFVTLEATAPRPDCGNQAALELPLLTDLGARYCCYAQVAQSYGVAIVRTYADFAFKCADYAADGARCLGVLDGHGKLGGYCVYFEDDGALTGEECLAYTQQDYRALFAALASRAANKRLMLRLPPSVLLDCPQACVTISAHCVLGVIDLPPLLAATGFNGGAIAVTDPLTPQNEGVFSLDGQRTNRPPQLTLSAGRLAQWAVGYRSLAELVASGDAVALDPAIVPQMDQIGTCRCFTVDEY